MWFYANKCSHANSIDKTASGDYLLSGRDTSTIYLISGVDKRIIWRLGGKYSNWTLPMPFSNQHDARVQSENATTMVISLFDNAINPSNPSKKSSTCSSTLLLALDKATWNATVLSSYTRPDGGFTRIRGNFQMLPGGASHAHWSGNNYMSEYDASGRKVLEAQLASHRFESYRSYKFNWTGFPTEEPAIKAFAYGKMPARATTAMYVSWNGATEVAFWHFYSVEHRSEVYNSREPIASVAHTGFETVAMVDGFVEHVMAIAVDADGKKLGESKVVSTEAPVFWGYNPDTASNLAADNDVGRGCIAGASSSRLSTASFPVADLTLRSGQRMIQSSESMVGLGILLAIALGAMLARVRRRAKQARLLRPMALT